MAGAEQPATRQRRIAKTIAFIETLKPAQIDKFTGYRYYAIEQLPRLNRILALKDLGLSLEQIGDLLKRDLPADQLRGMLTLKQAEIEQQMQAMQTQMRRVEARLKQIEREGKPSPYEVVIKSVEAQTIASCRRVVPNFDVMVDYRCEMYNALYRWLAEHDLAPQEHELAIYYNSEYVERDIDMELGTPVDRAAVQQAALPEALTVSDLPAVETMASVIHNGDMWDIGQAMAARFAPVEISADLSSLSPRDKKALARLVRCDSPPESLRADLWAALRQGVALGLTGYSCGVIGYRGFGSTTVIAALVALFGLVQCKVRGPGVVVDATGPGTPGATTAVRVGICSLCSSLSTCWKAKTRKPCSLK